MISQSPAAPDLLSFLQASSEKRHRPEGEKTIGRWVHGGRKVDYIFLFRYGTLNRDGFVGLVILICGMKWQRLVAGRVPLLFRRQTLDFKSCWKLVCRKEFDEMVQIFVVGPLFSTEIVLQ